MQLYCRPHESKWNAKGGKVSLHKLRTNLAGVFRSKKEQIECEELRVETVSRKQPDNYALMTLKRERQDE